MLEDEMTEEKKTKKWWKLSQSSSKLDLLSCPILLE